LGTERNEGKRGGRGSRRLGKTASLRTIARSRWWAGAGTAQRQQRGRRGCQGGGGMLQVPLAPTRKRGIRTGVCDGSAGNKKPTAGRQANWCRRGRGQAAQESLTPSRASMEEGKWMAISAKRVGLGLSSLGLQSTLALPRGAGHETGKDRDRSRPNATLARVANKTAGKPPATATTTTRTATGATAIVARADRPEQTKRGFVTYLTGHQSADTEPYRSQDGEPRGSV
jgi:hypothetical protein